MFYQKLKLLRVNASENLESLSISEGSHQDLTFLAQLDIWFCPNFVSFPCGGLFAPNLTKKFIHECEKLKSRPEGMNTSSHLLSLCNCMLVQNSRQGPTTCFVIHTRLLKISSSHLPTIYENFWCLMLPSYMPFFLFGLCYLHPRAS